MSLTNPNKVVTEERLSEFYQGIFPYLGGMPEMIANKFSRSDIYSTTEKIIGQWIDGKPLYQKIVTTGGSVPSGATLIFRQTMTGYDAILYTKSTDSAISIGVDTDYSTTEKIVGTWIDGKWIYQNTFTGSAIIGSTSWTTAFNIPKAGIAQIVGVFGTGSPSSGGQYWNLLAALDAHNTYIGFLAAGDNSTCDVRTITLQYTKTS